MQETIQQQPKRIVRLASSAKRRQQWVAFMVVAPPLLGTVFAIWLALRNGIGAVEVITLGLMYLICMLGITIGFHRYFAHKSFETSRFFSTVLAAMGSMAAES